MTSLRSHIIWPVIVTLTLGCLDSRSHSELPAHPTGAFTLERRPFTTDSLATPFGPVSVLVDSIGGLFFLGQSVDNHWVTHLDSTGRLLNRFGRSGSGPGELSGGGILLGGGGDTVVVVDTRRGAVVLFNAAGKYLGESQLRAPVFPLAVSGHVLYAVDPMEVMRGGFPRVMGFPLGGDGSGDPTTVLDSTSAVFRTAFGGRDLIGRPPPIPTYTVSGTWSAFADGEAGRIALFGPDTTYEFSVPFPPYRRGPKEEARLRAELTAALVPVRGPDGKMEPTDPALTARLDTLSREYLPYVAWPGLVVESDGRVITIAASNDSTVVDAYSGGKHLGRSVIDCYQPGKRISLRGQWIALQCVADADSTDSFELRLYRVRG